MCCDATHSISPRTMEEGPVDLAKTELEQCKCTGEPREGAYYPGDSCPCPRKIDGEDLRCSVCRSRCRPEAVDADVRFSFPGSRDSGPKLSLPPNPNTSGQPMGYA